MSEARLFSTNGFNGGVSVGIRADNYAEFVAIAQEVYGDQAGLAFAQSVFQTLLDQVPEAKAVANLNNGGVAVQSVQPQAAPNNVVPMPQAQAQPQAVPNPPTVPYPGDCPHGPRKYKSIQTKRGPWTFWECALPYQTGADNSQRCQNINV